MADNTTLDAGTGGDVIRTEDRTTFKTPVSLIDVGGSAGEALIGDGSNTMPISGTVDLGATDNAVLDSIVTALGGTLTVDGSGVTQPVSGTVTANLSATDNAVLDAIQTATEATQAAVEGTVTVDGTGTFATQVTGAGTVSADGVNSETVISGGNWSTNTWTGDGEQNDYQYVTVSLQVDEAGTLFFDFSPDGTNWSTFPTNGLAVTSGIHEYHGAQKGSRYFRPRFVGTGGRSYFRLFTYYSNVQTTLNAPLNQSISADADAVITRSVLVGANDNGTYTNVGVTDTGGLKVGQDAEVDSNNSTTTPLSGNTDFTGTATDVRGYGGITVTIFADQDSDANGMRFEFSIDGTNWDISVGGGFDYLASTGRQFQLNVQAQYFRVVFQNGASAQSAFRLQTLLHKVPPAITTIHRADANLKPDRSATFTKSVLMGQVNGSGDMVPVQLSAAGILKTTGSGGGVTDTAYNEDSSHSSGDAGSFILGVRRDTATSGASADGDYSSLNVDGTGRLWTHDPVVDAKLDTVISGSELQVDVVGALPAGTNNIGDVDVATIAAGSNLIGDVGIQGRTSGGLSIFYDNDLDETAVAVKASAGNLYALHVINLTAAPLYLQLFDVAQGSVTVGTTTPTIQFVVPGNADSDGAGFTFNIPQGIQFSTAITAACSTNSEGNTAPATNACHVNLFYK